MTDLDRMLHDNIIKELVMSSENEKVFSKDVAEGLLISDEEFITSKSKFLDFSATEPPEDAITVMSQLDAVALFNANARIMPLLSLDMILLVPVDVNGCIIKTDAISYFDTKLNMLRGCDTLAEFIELRSEYYKAVIDDYAAN